MWAELTLHSTAYYVSHISVWCKDWSNDENVQKKMFSWGQCHKWGQMRNDNPLLADSWPQHCSVQLITGIQGHPFHILIQDINTELWGCVARVVCECVDNECVINKCHVCCVCVCCGHNGSSLCFPLVTPPAGHPWVSTVPRHQSLGVPHCGWTRILTAAH